MEFKVGNVNKVLIAAKDLCRAGNKVVLDGSESYIEDKQTGARTKVYEKNNTYMIPLFIIPKSTADNMALPKPGFPRLAGQ